MFERAFSKCNSSRVTSRCCGLARLRLRLLLFLLSLLGRIAPPLPPLLDRLFATALPLPADLPPQPRRFPRGRCRRRGSCGHGRSCITKFYSTCGSLCFRSLYHLHWGGNSIGIYGIVFHSVNCFLNLHPDSQMFSMYLSRLGPAPSWTKCCPGNRPPPPSCSPSQTPSRPAARACRGGACRPSSLARRRLTWAPRRGRRGGCSS